MDVDDRKVVERKLLLPVVLLSIYLGNPENRYDVPFTAKEEASSKSQLYGWFSNIARNT